MITGHTVSRLLALLLPLLMDLAMTGNLALAQSATASPFVPPRAQLEHSAPAESKPEARPWTIGVTEERQKQAKILYEAGNRYFASALFAAATVKYRSALQHWNHPGIHYNLALAQISMDRPVQAYQSIVQALHYGAEGLRPDEYQRAVEYRRQLRQQIAEVEVVCLVPGASVTLNGKPLFTGPDRIATFVLPGKYQIIASKARHVTTSQTVTLAAGSSTKVELALLAEDQATIEVRRWTPWKPWAVVGVGVGLGAAATALHWQSIATTYQLNEQARIRCREGCDGYPVELHPMQKRAMWQRSGAYAGYAAASVLLTTGVLLTYMNRPRAAENKALHDLVRISLHLGGPDGGSGVSVHIPF